MTDSLTNKKINPYATTIQYMGSDSYVPPALLYRFNYLLTACPDLLGDGMADNNGAKFSTLDTENDVWSIGKCAEYHHAGWWFRQCTKANLNGRFKHTEVSGDDSIFWDTFQQNDMSLKHVEMKMKPV